MHTENKVCVKDGVFYYDPEKKTQKNTAGISFCLRQIYEIVNIFIFFVNKTRIFFGGKYLIRFDVFEFFDLFNGSCRFEREYRGTEAGGFLTFQGPYRFSRDIGFYLKPKRAYRTSAERADFV